MRKLLNKKNIPLIVFISIEFILWILILFLLQYTELETRYFEYAAVCLAVIASIVFVRKPKFLHLSFLFTLVADLFLTLLRPQLIELGIATFSLVAITHAIYIYINQKEKIKLPHLIVRIILSIAAPIIMAFIPGTNAMMIIASFYGVNLILNVIFSFTLVKKDILLSVGLILFFMCDFEIMTSTFISMGILPGGGDFLYRVITSQDFNMAWAFYVPCLVCLVLSFKVNNPQSK